MAEIELSRGDLEGDLPKVCLCCGASAEVWQQKSFELVADSEPVALGAISRLFQLGQSVFRDKLTIRAPFCHMHQNHWRRRKLIIVGSIAAAVLLLLGCFWMMKAVGPNDNGLLFLGIGLGGTLLGGLIAAIAHETSVHATQVTAQGIILKGVSHEFVVAMSERR